MESKSKETKMADIEAAKTKILINYSKLFPLLNIKPDNMASYIIALQNVSTVELKLAMKLIILTNNAFPTAAEILQAATNIREFILEEHIPDVDEAWTEIVNEINRAYLFRKPVFTTPEITQAVRCIGYVNLCMMNVSDSSGYFRQFKIIYDSIIRRKKENKRMNNIINSVSAEQIASLKSLLIEKTKRNILISNDKVEKS